MRVTYLSVSDQLGGSEVMLLQALGEVRRVRPDWSFSVVLPGQGPLAAAAASLGAEVSVVPMPAPLARLGEWASGRRRASLAWSLARAASSMPGYERAMARAIAALRPDVLHSNGFKTHVIASRLRRRPALVWHIHEYVSARPMTRRLLARYASRADAIVANSRSVAHDVSAATGTPAAIIYNGVDLERFHPDGPAADLDAAAGLAPAPPGTMTVGLVATFSRWKGHETFLRALAALPKELNVRGYVIGGAVYDTAGSQHSLGGLRGLVSSLGLTDRVGFTGFVSRPADAMRALDVVVHASTDREPFGLVVAEGMACGRALTTSGTGGASELIEEDVTALRHVPGDPADLARVLHRLVSDRDLRARLGTAARARAVRLFDASRLGEEFAGAYLRAVQARTSPRRAGSGGHHP